MDKLMILYDAKCGFCVKCRWWLMNQPKYVEMEFLPSGGPDTLLRFPELHATGMAEELVVVSDEGGVYRGADAWLMCLWALEEYREWAEDLAEPALKPFARGAFALVSAGRRKLSALFGLQPEDLAQADPPRCTERSAGDSSPDLRPTRQ